MHLTHTLHPHLLITTSHTLCALAHTFRNVFARSPQSGPKEEDDPWDRQESGGDEAEGRECPSTGEAHDHCGEDCQNWFFGLLCGGDDLL